MNHVDKQYVLQRLDIAALYGEVLSRISPPKTDGEVMAICPFHDDHTPSLSVNLRTGHYYCHACRAKGDIFGFIQAKYNLDFAHALEKLADFAGIHRQAPSARKELPECPVDWNRPTRVFSYYHTDGSHAFDVLRWEKQGFRKAIRQSRGLDATGQRIRNKGDARDCPYNLHSDSESKPSVANSDFVVVVEGENKADALIERGICATCNPGGAGKWRAGYADYFRQKDIVILPDNDSPGHTHAQQVAASLFPVAKSVKILELPGLPEKGDILDWLQFPGNTIDLLQSLMQAASYWKVAPDAPSAPSRKRPLGVDWKRFQGTTYLQAPLEPYNFLLRDAFLKAELGVIAGPPGVGKGLFAMQMAVYMAVGLPVFDWWQVSAPTTVAYLSAEDSWQVLQHRLANALASLPENLRQKAAGNVFLIPVRGCVQIVEAGHNSSIIETDNLADLRTNIAELRPGLVFLDTLSRFVAIEENDNAVMTRACGPLEEIAEEFQCNFIFLHHVNKTTGEFANNEKTLSAALSQAAIRGASALAGAVRFAVTLAPLEKAFAVTLLGNAYKGNPSGTALAVRTVKKNVGPAEERFFLLRGENGLLERISAENGKFTDIEAKAHLLAEEVVRRHAAGGKILSRSRGGCEALGLGAERSELVVKKALELGLVSCARSGRGYGLGSGLINCKK